MKMTQNRSFYYGYCVDQFVVWGVYQFDRIENGNSNEEYFDHTGSLDHLAERICVLRA